MMVKEHNAVFTLHVSNWDRDAWPFRTQWCISAEESFMDPVTDTVHDDRRVFIFRRKHNCQW